jgi:hypothetical protein
MATVYAPPEPPATRGRRMLAPAATIGALSLATLALHVRDPHSSGTWGFCPSAAMGWYCPGCGGLRAVNDLTNGQVGAALSSNIMVTLLIPVVVAGLLLWTSDRWRGRSRDLDGATVTKATIAFAAVAVTFSVVRNLAFGAWLAP